MDKSIVSKSLMNAKRLMNNPDFNRKVNGYIDEGAGADGYMPSVQSARQYGEYDPLDYSQMAQAGMGGINTKLPKQILESMLNNPINVTPASAGFGSVLEGIDTEELERQAPVQRQRRKLNESAPQQMPMMQPAGIDSNYLKFLVKEAIAECMEDLKKEILSENTLRGLKIGAGNKVALIDQKGNLYEGTMQLKKKAQ